MFGLKLRQPGKLSLRAGVTQKLNGKRIVIVDDDQVVLKAFSRRLQSDGFTVFSAPNCSDGLTVIRETRPDLVLLDMNFRQELGVAAWDGVVLMKWMRFTASLQVPVVIITGTKDDSVKQRALAAGAAGFFDKSQGYLELLSILGEALNPIPVSSEPIA